MIIGRRTHYAGVLAIPEGKSRKVEVRHLRHPPGTVLHSGNLRTTFHGQKSQAIKFSTETVWHELSETDHGVWMTDLPIEQRQTDELVRRASGRVLVGGLGLGYAVAALAARPRVKEIVVIERSPDIIKLVWDSTVKTVRRIRRGQPAVKLSIIKSDLFEYLENRQAARSAPDAAPEFQWGLFDIWQMDNETTFHDTVVPLRRAAHGVVRTLECWNEDVMRAQLYNGLHTRLVLLKLPPHPEDHGGATGPSLDFLCEPHQSKYTDWAVPFWRWYREHQDELDRDPQLLNFIAADYVKAYGRPELDSGLPKGLQANWHVPALATA